MKAFFTRPTILFFIFLLFITGFTIHATAQTYGKAQGTIIRPYGCSNLPFEWVNVGLTSTIAGAQTHPNINSVVIQIDYDDGNIVTYTGTDLTLNDITATTRTYTVNLNHLYANVAPTKCVYNIRVESRVNGTLIPGASFVAYYTVWRTDDFADFGNFGSGIFTDVQTGNNIVELCQGESRIIQFRDNTICNCNTSAPNMEENDALRQTQFVYGTDQTNEAVTINRIPNVWVSNGVGLVSNASGGNTGTSTPRPSTVTDYPANSPSSLSAVTDLIVVNGEYTKNTPVGSTFDVALHNWNPCNPRGDRNNSIKTWARIIIVDRPLPLTPSEHVFCHGSTNSVTKPAGVNFVTRWYRDTIDWYNPNNPNARDNQFIYEGSTINPDALTGSDRLKQSPDAGDIHEKVYYVTRKLATGTCESEPVRVRITMKPQLILDPALYSVNDASVCPNQEITFTYQDAPPTITPPGSIFSYATKYNWTYDAARFAFISQTSNTLTLRAINPGAVNDVSSTVSMQWVYDQASPLDCPSNTLDNPVTIHRYPAVSMGGDKNYCHNDAMTVNINAITDYNAPNPSYNITYTDGYTNWTENNVPKTGRSNISIANNVVAAGTFKAFKIISITDNQTGCTLTESYNDANGAGFLTGDATLARLPELLIPEALNGPANLCAGENGTYQIGNLVTAPSVTITEDSPDPFYTNKTAQTQYNWARSGNITLSSTSPGTTEATYLAGTAGTAKVQITRTYKATPQINGQNLPACSSDVKEKDINIHPIPNVFIAPPVNVCDGSNASIELTFNGAPVGNYTVNYTIGSNSGVRNNVSDNPYTLIIPAAELVTGSNAFAVSVHQESWAGGGCASSQSSATVWVRKNPTVTISGTPTVCQGQNAEFDLTIDGDDTQYNVFYQLDGGAEQSQIVGAATHTLTINTTLLTVANHSIALTRIQRANAPSCEGVSNSSTTFTVRGPITKPNAGPDQAFCAETSNLTATTLTTPTTPNVGNGEVMTWNLAEGATGTSITSPNANSTAFNITSGNWGIYKVELIIDNGACPAERDTVVLDFGGEPSDPVLGVMDNVCVNEALQLNANAPALGTGVWSVNSTDVTITDPTNRLSTATTTVPGTYRFTWTITSGSCDAKSAFIDLTFYELPVVDTKTWATCFAPGQPINLDNFTSNPASTTYWWKVTAISPTVVPGTWATTGTINSGVNLEFPADTNTDDFDHQYQLQVVGYSNGCPSDTVTMDFCVKSKPELQVSDKELCEGVQLTITPYDSLLIKMPFDELILTSDNTDTGINNIHQTGLNNAAEDYKNGLDFTVTNNTNASLVTNLTLKVIKNGVESDAVAFKVTVHPNPDIIASDLSFCQGETLSIPLSSDPNSAAAVYSWVNPDGNLSLIDPAFPLSATGATPAFNFTSATNETGSVITAELQLSATYPTGCPSNTKSIFLNLRPKPIFTPAQADTAFCPDEPVAINFKTNITSGGETFTWTQKVPGTIPGFAGGTGAVSTIAPANNGNTNLSTILVVTAEKDGCSTTHEFKVDIKPKPQIINPVNVIACPDSLIKRNFTTSNVTGANFFWYNNNLNTGLSASGIDSIQFTSGAVTNSAQTSGIWLVAEKDGCRSDSTERFSITINPTPIITPMADVSACPGDFLTFSDFSATPNDGVSYHWTNSNTQLDIAASGDGKINNTLAKQTTDSIVGILTVRALRLNCASPIMQFNAIIKPKPVLNLVDSVSVCPGSTIDPVDFSANRNYSNLQYQWSNSDINIGLNNSGTGQITPFTATSNTALSNADNSPRIAYINYHAELDGCTTDPMQFKIKVFKTPYTTDIASTNNNLCVSIPGQPTSAIYNVDLPLGTTGSTYQWTVQQSNPVANAPTATALTSNNNQFSINPFGPNPWTSILRVQETSIDGCLGPIKEIQISAYPRPLANAGIDQDICLNTNAILGGNPVATVTSGPFSYSWIGNNLNDYTAEHPQASPQYQSMYEVTVTDIPTGCKSLPDTAIVYVNAIPSKPSAISPQPACEGDVPPTLTSTGENVRWYSDANGLNLVAIGNTFTHNIFTPCDTFFYATQMVNGCESPAQMVRLSIRQRPGFPIVKDTSACEEKPIPPLFAEGVGIRWYADPSLTTPIRTGNQLSFSTQLSHGTYTYYVTQTMGFCEGPPATVRLTIYPKPEKPVVEQPAATCYGDSVPYLVAQGANIRWYSDVYLSTLLSDQSIFQPGVTDPSPETNPYKFYAVRVENGCYSAPSEVKMVINPIPVITKVETQNQTTCNSGDGVIQIIAYGNAPLSYTINNWDSQSPNSEFLGLNTGSYHVGVQNKYGCVTDGGEYAISAGGAPPAPYAEKNARYCEGDAIAAIRASGLPGATIKWYDGAIPAEANIISTLAEWTPTPTYGMNEYWAAQDVGGCVGPPRGVFIELSKTPGAPIVKDTSICQGLQTPVLQAKSEPGAVVFWYEDAALSKLVGTGNYFYSGKTATGNYTFWLNQSINGCVGPTSQMTLTINPTPDVVTVNDTHGCQGAVPALQVSSGDSIRWYADPALTNKLADGPTFTGNTIVGQHVFFVTQSNQWCQSKPATVVQTVNAVPSKLNIMDDGICEGMPNPTFVAQGYSVKWYDSGLTKIEDGPQFKPDSTAISTYTYFVTQTLNGCESPRDTFTFSILSKPQPPVIANLTSCQGDLNPTFTGSSDHLYWYQGLSGTPSSIGSNFTPQQTTPGIHEFRVREVVGACASDYSTVQLVINPKPVYDVFKQDVTSCNATDGQFDFIASAGPFSGSIFEYSINGGTNWQSNQTFTGLQSAMYHTAVRNEFGCITSRFDTLKSIDYQPASPWLLQNATYCQGANYQPLYASSLESSNFIWRINDPLSAPIDTVVDQLIPSDVLGTTDYFVSIRVGSCESLPSHVQITINPVPAAPLANDVTVCEGLPVPRLHAHITPGNLTSWYDSGYRLINRDSIFDTRIRNSGTYTFYVSQTAKGCESDKNQVTLSINPKPAVEFGLINKEGCSPLSVQFTTSGPIDEFKWDFGDGTTNNTTLNGLQHTFENSSNDIKLHQVKLWGKTAQGCELTYSDFVTVYPTKDFNIKASMPNKCHPVNVTYLAPTGAAEYRWTMGSGYEYAGSENAKNETLVNPFYDRDTTYRIKLTATTELGCVDTSSLPITVKPRPKVDFTIASEGCTPYSPFINNLSMGASSYQWEFGDNTSTETAANPNHIFTNTLNSPVNYTVRLKGSNDDGCSNEQLRNIRVYPEIKSSFSSDTIGCHPFLVRYSDNSLGAGIYTWDLGDGNYTFESNPIHEYQNNTDHIVSYTVKQLVRNGTYPLCKDSSEQTIYVYPKPSASFIAAPIAQVFPDRTVTVTNNSDLKSNPDAWSHLWNFGDQFIAKEFQPVPHMYDTTGYFRIHYTVYNAYCKDTAITYINITPPAPHAGFDSIPQACAPYTVQFQNRTLFAKEYIWDFGDGNFSYEFNPVHTYENAGFYVIRLTAISATGHRTDYLRELYVHPKPKADFSVKPAMVFVGDQGVRVFDQSVDAYYYLWDYGDGSQSVRQKPEPHFYKAEGKYNISLIVSTNTIPTCSDTLTLDEVVEVQEGGTIKFPNAFRPDPSGPNGGRVNPGGEPTNNVFYPPITRSIIQYKLMIFNRWGTEIFVSTDLNVGWDGYYKGKLCDPGVYIWKAVGKYATGQSFTMMGDVTLIR